MSLKGGKLEICFVNDGADDGLGPLKDMCITTEIGDKRQNVLKNGVEKLEKFIIDVLQKKLFESVVLPNVVSLDLLGESPPNT